MPNIKADEIVKQGSTRHYIQFGGPQPGNAVRYAGQDAQYMTISGVSLPESGGVNPVWVPDPTRIGGYRLVSKTVEPQDLPEATITMLEKSGTLPRQLMTIGCSLNVYDVHGLCGDLSDPSQWSGYKLVYGGGKVTDKDLGDRSSWDSDDQHEDSLTAVFSRIYPVGQLGFGEKAASQIDREVVDVVFAPGKKCDDCAFGDKWAYALTRPSGTGSPGLPAEVIYTTDGGLTTTQINITPIGATEEVYAIDVVGSYLVVIGTDAYYYAGINILTGAPGTFTKVTNGFVASKSPRDLFVLSPREVFFVGLGGYVYKATDIAAGVSVIDPGNATTSNLARIAGSEVAMVAVGASGAVIKSINRGATWGIPSSAPAGTLNITAVEVLDNLVYWVGTAAPIGKLFWTADGGESWTEKTFTGSGSGGVTDIRFATPEVGYFAHTTTTPAGRLFATEDGGENWKSSAQASNPRIQNLITNSAINRIGIPATSDPGWASNSLALAGLAANNTDGFLAFGYAARL